MVLSNRLKEAYSNGCESPSPYVKMYPLYKIFSPFEVIREEPLMRNIPTVTERASYASEASALSGDVHE